MQEEHSPITHHLLEMNISQGVSKVRFVFDIRGVANIVDHVHQECCDCSIVGSGDAAVRFGPVQANFRTLNLGPVRFGNFEPNLCLIW